MQCVRECYPALFSPAISTMLLLQPRRLDSWRYTSFTHSSLQLISALALPPACCKGGSASFDSSRSFGIRHTLTVSHSRPIPEMGFWSSAADPLSAGQRCKQARPVGCTPLDNCHPDVLNLLSDLCSFSCVSKEKIIRMSIANSPCNLEQFAVSDTQTHSSSLKYIALRLGDPSAGLSGC